ncbi:SAM-dependent methyltransferase [Streptomyces cylindrosporus]|uniref:Class I SAM-dependent methyltransferase n=1 Tax=Streptomyces cylindrosporus TaxID=2927583 RepID=A0ABS9YFY4_9ACTN|nr:class I SAM-dependent methyltransferase [Streptomyces cylindrosporus]MCI3276148.1 class I SAM-dependent methyltransferase [Streptomyces cylindrosporus]
MTYEESAVTRTIDRLLNDHQHELDPSADGALDNLDQFHIGGAEAVERLIPTLALTPGDIVLDVGSGFGGPARQIARRTGNHVVGVDITPAYVEAARDLTARAGLSDLVRFHTGDIADFRPPDPPGAFGAALTMHVQMNVRDKTTWFRHIAQHLAPGAHLAVWEICQPYEAELPWPTPWSLDGTDSFIVSADTLRADIENAGFTATDWANESAWVKDWITKTFANGLPPGPALPMLLDDGYTRVINYATALTDGTLEIWRGCFTKNDFAKNDQVTSS